MASWFKELHSFYYKIFHIKISHGLKLIVKRESYYMLVLPSTVLWLCMSALYAIRPKKRPPR